MFVADGLPPLFYVTAADLPVRAIESSSSGTESASSVKVMSDSVSDCGPPSRSPDPICTVARSFLLVLVGITDSVYMSLLLEVISSLIADTALCDSMY